jgi:UDP-4-amino-4,6-dideoxy-N-acetyl-beta-L-altrosamine N-acetyltransferase
MEILRPSPKVIRLIPLTRLDTEIQLKIREIRNEENIRKWMYTDHIIGKDEHLNWIRGLNNDDKQIVFAVMENDKTPLGVVSVTAMNRLHRKSDWAFYLTEKARGGLGSALEFAIINFIFNVLGIEKLNCEVIHGNDPVVKLHKKFMFKEEGFRRSNIIKNGTRVGVHLLGLTREDWLAGKVLLQEKYTGIFDKFSIEIQWQTNEKKDR